MPEHYDVHRAIEHVRHGHAQDSQDSRVVRLMPLVAAILAVLAGLSSLYAGRLTSEVLSLKDEALLSEVTAADLWSEYQADSLKAHLYEIASTSADGPAAKSLHQQALTFRAEQPALAKKARALETDRDAKMAGATATEIRKSALEIALAFFEVAIVLASIAAMTKRPSLLILGAIVGLGGLFFGLRGALGI
jgi:hypothetical protein